MSSWLGLEGARVLVAGAGGIGLAVARGFAAAGSAVVVADRDPARLAEARTHGMSVLEMDAGSPEACRATVTAAVDRLAGLDVLVHAIGINRRKPLEACDDDDWNAILNTNLSSAFWLVRATLPVMRTQRSGRILFFSSVSSVLAHQHHGPYAASKGGLNQLARVLAHEVASEGITVNAIAPGYTETDLTRAYLEQGDRREQLTSLVPAGRLGTPDELVGPALFLASRHAGFVTGQVLYVDGGRTLV